MNSMNRKTKNIVMIAASVLLVVAMAFTVSAAGNGTKCKAPPQSIGSTQGMQKQQMHGGPGRQGPGGDQQGSGGDQQGPGDQQNGQPPAPPSGDTQQGSSDQQNGQPPAPPSGDTQQGSGSQQNGQPPAPPSGDNNQQKHIAGNMKGGKGAHRISSIEGKYYGLLGAESVAFALIIMYLIMSKMNTRTFNETFKTKSRIAVFVLATILAAGCLTQTEAAIGKTLANDPIKTQQQIQAPGGQPGSGNEQGQGGNQGPGEQGQDTQSVKATGATTVDGKKETLNETYTSTKADENAILVTGGGTLTSDGATINKKSGDSSNTGSSDFSGVNAALLVNDNSTATIKNAKITTSAKGANGVFATGEKSAITISDSTITTTGEASSRGLDATYGGTISATNVKIKTQGGSCAAMATDRGEGTVTATKSTFETNGAGSPVIYSTGKISMTDSSGKANGAQIAVVEGKNSATITKSEVSCSGAGNRGDVDVAGVMVYQSMSGDAGEGTGNFTAVDSKLSISKDSKYYKTAPMFFVTNTDAVIKLTNTELNYGSGILLSAKGTSEWGNQGSNGGTVTLNAEKQTLTGDVELDKLSSLTMNLTDGSTYTGAVNSDKSAKAIKLTLDKTSKIKLTGDTYVTELEDADNSYSNIDFNGHTLYVNGKALAAQ